MIMSSEQTLEELENNAFIKYKRFDDHAHGCIECTGALRNSLSYVFCDVGVELLDDVADADNEILAHPDFIPF
jgi:hypothetical protein